MKKFISVLFIFTVIMFVMSGLSYAQSTSESGADANAGVSATFEGSESKRNMPNSVLPGFPGFSSYFSKTLMTHEYMGIEKLVEMKHEWSEFNITTFTNEVKNDIKKVNIKSYSMHLYKDKPEKLKITFIKPEENAAFMGTLVASAEGDGIPMEAVFAAIAKKAFEKGANVIYPMNQGAKRVLSASSTGVALGYTHVVMGGGSESAAGAGTAGIGVSKGESSYRHEPFVRVSLFRVNQESYDNLKIFPNGAENTNVLQEKIKSLQEKVDQHQKESQNQ